MKKDLLKYKHYFIALGALLFYLYITEPLFISILEQKNQIDLNEKKLSKINGMIESEAQIISLLNDNELKLKNAESFFYKSESESEFKLELQKQIEEILQEANCEIETLDWNGKVDLENLYRWNLNLRYQGNPACIIQASRKIESLLPIVNINNYRYTARRINGAVRTKITAILELTILQDKA